MDLNALRMFIAAVQSGSLSAAAEKIEVPLPTLSRRISELEQSLNSQLLIRSKRGVKLTTMGQRLFDQSLYPIESLLEAERTVRSDMRHMHGRLRLSLPDGFEFWGKLIIDFQRRYPHIQISCQYTDIRLDLIEEDIDVALRIGDLVTDKVIAKRHAPLQRLLVATPAFVQAFGEPQSIEELDNFALAGWYFTHGSATKWQLGNRIYTPKLKLSANSFRQLLDYTLADMAICEMPEFVAKPHLDKGELRPILPRLSMPELPVHQIYAAHRHPSAILRVYLDFCDMWLAQHK
ncbi:DNA-binding transcriptional LysR family regulator [Mesocricetibacter intestinalis]|uniref:DNA-binding transcriptional LysR family regulator n=1 Tax=Mesocricetibacter intestinalis TaxID=1521930 RepID=A0A4R6VC92_9PAST|nr:LysR family transcriptional regulator [Mesocricetibacter intestinalis]TDQ59867.1 DNA-binding transcriptional LysR family regulator [Mesocricetibacter intestinalis]